MKNLYVQYITAAHPPHEHATRMTYFTSEKPKAEMYSWGTGQPDFSKESLEAMVNQNTVIKLPKPFKLKESKDLFLQADNTIIAATAWDASKDQEVVANLDEL